MNLYWKNLARKNWQVLAAVLVLAVFGAVHAAAFKPALARYNRNVRRAAELGMPLDATGGQQAATPRVMTLLTVNSLNAAVAEEQGTSGALVSGLLDEVTRRAARCGLEVLATEQGLVTQLPATVLVRAEVTMHGGYSAFTALLDDFARSGRLIAVERFTIQADREGGQTIELSVSQLILKRTGAAR